MRPMARWLLFAMLVVGSACGNVGPKTSGPPRGLALVGKEGQVGPGKRRALVIGNAHYKRGADGASRDLVNPINDATAVEEVLRGASFDAISHAEDLDQKRLVSAISTFVDTLGRDDTAVVFYAGHGMEIGGKNFLIPVDFDAKSETEGVSLAYGLDMLLDHLHRRGGGANVVILDACRNDPFTRAWRGVRGGVAGGFADVEAPPGTLVWFSTQPRQTAEDGGAGGNSPFSAALVRALKRSNTTLLDDLTREVSREVDAATEGRQRPFKRDDLQERFSFATGPLRGATAIVAPGPVVGSPVQASRALLVGVDAYTDPRFKAAAMDTHKELASMKRALGRVGYTEIRTIEGASSTLATIRDGLDQLKRASRSGDRVAFYFAGMGLSMPGNSPETDGKDEGLMPADAALGPAGDAGRTTMLVDDELASRVAELRGAVGPTGHVLVALDAYRLFDDPSELPSVAAAAKLAPLTVVQPGFGWGLVARETNTSADDADGVLTRALASALENADPNDPYRRTIRSMRAVATDPDAIALEGDIDVSVGTGRPTIGGTFVEVDRRLTYGPQTAYVRAGKLDGLFSGTEVELHEPGTLLPGSKALVRGTVMQTGFRWARIELERPEPGVAWALPVTRAMPPIRIRVSLDSSVVAERAALAREVAALGLDATDPVVNIRIQEQGPYLYVSQSPTEGRGTGDEPVALLSETPIAKADRDVVSTVMRTIWRHAYVTYLQSPLRQTAGFLASSTHGERCRGGGRRIAFSSSSSGASSSRVLQLEFHGVPGTALAFSAEGIAALVGAETFVGEAVGCLPVDAKGADMPFVHFAASEVFDPRVAINTARPTTFGRVVHERPDEVPIGVIPPTTAKALAQLDSVAMSRGVARLPRGR